MNTNSCDPGPARKSFADHYRLVKQVVLDMAREHTVRKNLITKKPKPPLSDTDPFQSVDVQLALARARTQGRNEAFAELSSQQRELMGEIQKLRHQILEESSPRIRAQLQAHLAERERAAVPLLLDEEDTEERPALRSEPFEKASDEMLYAFFIKCVNNFLLKHGRRAYSARLNAFNISFLEQLIPESMNIRLIRDDALPDNLMIMM